MADNGLTAIDWLAKTAPPGWHVVIKEHPGATSPRPTGYWERIRAYPNVIVAATLEDPQAIAERAQAVAVIHGSVGAQAAVAGKPVITFSPVFVGLEMPHVLLARSYEQTGQALRAIRDETIPDLASRRRAGRAFLTALEKCGFPIEDGALLRGVAGSGTIDRSDIERLADTLMESLEPAAAQAPARAPAQTPAQTPDGVPA